MESDSIPDNGRDLTPKEFVKVWAAWLCSASYETENSVYTEDDGEFSDIISTPTLSEVAEWAAQLWKNDDDFKSHLKHKWGKEAGGDKEEDGGEADSPRKSLNDEFRNKGKEGQADLTSFK
jgi:hypothetical protein